MDPGIDDALALYAALARLPVHGIATVAGNAEGIKTYQNMWHLLRLVSHDHIAVLRGSDEPLHYPLHTAPHVHGASGLNGYTFQESCHAPLTTPYPWVAWPESWRVETALVHLIATGPLTNVAKLLWCAGDQAKEMLSGITLMGGAIEKGNVTSTAEFNFYVDPDAADWVMRAPVPVSMIGLDVTWKARMPWGDVDRLRDLGEPGRMLADVLNFYGRSAERHPMGLAIHDAIAVAAYARPDLFSWQDMRLTVLRDGTWRGTVARVPETAPRNPVRVAMDVDVPAVLQWLMESLLGFLKRFSES